MEKISPIRSSTSVDLGAQLADLKIHFYHQSLLVTALIDLLVDKGIIQQDELSEEVKKIDQSLSIQIEKDKK